jgi:hypothetical protein
MRLRRTISIALIAAFACTAACNTPSATSKSFLPTAGHALQGNVHGGQQPVSGATLQLYAAGTAGDGTAATPLISVRVSTSDGTGNASNANANPGNAFNSLPAGAFTLDGEYTCPTPSTLVYLVATGGNPGLSAGVTNAALALMVALGPCSALNSATYVTVNEVTTVATVAALYPYMSNYYSVASGPGDAPQILSAFTLVNQYVNPATGVAPGPDLPANMYGSSTEINALANTTASCVNSTGGLPGDSNNCGMLLSLTGYAGKPIQAKPFGTIDAIRSIYANPTTNIAPILNLAPAAAPFQPTLTTIPATLATPIVIAAATPTFTLPSGTYTGTQNVGILETTPGASLYYTTDGTTPTPSSTPYTGPLTIASTRTVRALAVAGTVTNTASASASYTILPQANAPTFLETHGLYATAHTVPLSGGGTPGTVVYYTVDGTSPTASSTLCGPYCLLTISVSESVQAIAIAPGYANSYVSYASFTVQPVAAPTFSVPGGPYTSAQNVDIRSETSPATICYTTDNSTPSLSSTCNNFNFTLTVNNSQTVKAIAYGTGYSNNALPNSAISAATYTITVPTATPTFFPAGGSFSSAQTVSLSDTTPGSSIYFTLDLSTPTISSTLYTAPFTVSTSTIVKAFAVENLHSPSAVTGASYTITLPTCQTPTFSPSGGLFASETNVTIFASGLPGSTIHYTLDGTTPNAASPSSSFVTISTSGILKAIATAPGCSPSAVASASFLIQPPSPPIFSIPGGTYTGAQTVYLYASPGSMIFYTTDGTAPTPFYSPQSSGPITVSTSETIKAIAYTNVYGNSGAPAASAVSTATYIVH